MHTFQIFLADHGHNKIAQFLIPSKESLVQRPSKKVTVMLTDVKSVFSFYVMEVLYVSQMAQHCQTSTHFS